MPAHLLSTARFEAHLLFTIVPIQGSEIAYLQLLCPTSRHLYWCKKQPNSNGLIGMIEQNISFECSAM